MEGTFQKELLLDSTLKDSWVSDISDSYTCPNATGSIRTGIFGSFCFFETKKESLQFCMADPMCQSISCGAIPAYSGKYLCGASQHIHTGTPANASTETYIKTYRKTDTAPGQLYTCPPATNVQSNECIFNTLEEAKKFCSGNAKCWGVACTAGTCKPTLAPTHSYSEIIVGVCVAALLCCALIPMLYWLFFRKTTSVESRLISDRRESDSNALEFKAVEIGSCYTHATSVLDFPPPLYRPPSVCESTYSKSSVMCDPSLWSVNETCHWLIRIGLPMKMVEKGYLRNLDGKKLFIEMSNFDNSDFCEYFGAGFAFDLKSKISQMMSEGSKLRL